MRLISATHSVDIPYTHRLVFIALVVGVHLAVLGIWEKSPDKVSHAVHEMAVSLMMPQPMQTVSKIPKPLVQQTKQQPAEKLPAVMPVHIESTPQTTINPLPVAMPVTPISTLSSSPSTPVLPDREPDFQAAYLNNPVPIYPLIARRMGWQGKVIVSVEVLMNGTAGMVKIYQSSGREALDNAALAAVKNWRFVAARQAGQLVNKTFLVPIPFKLEEAE